MLDGVPVRGAGALKESLFRLGRGVLACHVAQRIAEQQRNTGGIGAPPRRLEPLQKREAGVDRGLGARALGRVQLLPTRQIAARAGSHSLWKRGLLAYAQEEPDGQNDESPVRHDSGVPICAMPGRSNQLTSRTAIRSAAEAMTVRAPKSYRARAA